MSRRTGWAVDVAMHAPGQEGDQRNTHAHILCTTRKMELDETGQLVMGAKTRDWDVIATGKDLVMAERKEWEHQVNRMLEMAQSKARVDSRSFEAQGRTEQIPQIHLGVSASQMERKGIETERGNRNRDVAEHNQTIVDLRDAQYIRKLKERVAQDLEDKRRWEGMSAEDLRSERRSIDLGSERQFAFQDTEVQKASTPLEQVPYYASQKDKDDYVAGKIGWLNQEQLDKREKADNSAYFTVKHYQEKIEQWRRYHPYKATMWDMGLPNKELSNLVKHYNQASTEKDKTEAELNAFKRDRQAAEYERERAIRNAIYRQSAEYTRCQSRLKELDKILTPKQEQEWALKRERDRERGRGGRSIGF